MAAAQYGASDDTVATRTSATDEEAHRSELLRRKIGETSANMASADDENRKENASASSISGIFASQGRDQRSAFAFENRDEEIEFLLHASEILASSLEYETTLKTVANLVVPRLAEWCTVHILQSNGKIEQLALAHADPAMVDFARKVNEKYPSDYNSQSGIGAIIRTGKPEMIREITDEMIIAGAKDEEHLALLRKLGLSSFMGVPLKARGQTFGVISFLSSGGRLYSDTDYRFAESLGIRAGISVDNARLYQEAQRATRELKELNAELEHRVEERTDELHTAREKDRYNLHRIKTMLEHLPMASLMMDENDTIIELNDAYCRMFNIGLSAQEALRISPEELNTRFQKCLLKREEHMDAVRSMVAARQTFLGFDIYLNDGRIIQRDYVAIHEGDTFLGQLFLYRDVTRERRMDAAKSEFMSLASHQLRTPLTSMRWAVSMLGRGLQDKATDFEKKLLQEAADGVGRMCGTVDTMLHISRLESGEVQLNESDVCLQGFLEELMEYEGREFQSKQHRISIDCPSDLTIHTDPGLLKELFGNLINNAFKYTPANGSIRLAASREAGTVLFTIRDSGYGIPTHQQEHLFKKFFRGDNVVGKVTKGTGLGLYLASLLTHLLGGEIGCVSDEGRGTAFTLRFPGK